MKNNALSPWRPHERVLRYNYVDTDDIEIHLTEFILDQSAGIANQALEKAIEASKITKQELCNHAYIRSSCRRVSKSG